jgi:CHRD domain
VNGRLKLAAAVAVLAAGAVGGTAALAGGGKEFNERLTGYEETPMSISTTGNGRFRAQIRSDRQEIRYRLRWADLEDTVTQAHIHLGQRATTGGISVFLCTNLGNGPAGTQACPAGSPATIEGTIRPADVIGPAPQGIAAGEFGELVRGMKAGATYVNVHSAKYPSGEIRAQLDKSGRHGGRRR